MGCNRCIINGHYSLIKNFNRLCSYVTKNEKAKFFCKGCMCHYPSKERLDEHFEQCKTFDHTKIIMPKEEDKYIEFKKYNHQMRVPFSIHCDFECITAPISGCNKEEQKTTKYQNHLD